LISATLHAYRSTRHVVLPKHAPHVVVVRSPNWMIFSHRRALDVYTERIPLSLCLRGWLLGWIHSVDPWYLCDTKVPNLQPLRFSTVELCMNVEHIGHFFKSTWTVIIFLRTWKTSKRAFRPLKKALPPSKRALGPWARLIQGAASISL